MSDLGYEWENLSKRYVETPERKASLCGDMAKGMQLPRSGIWAGLWKRPTMTCAQGGTVVQAEMAVTIQLSNCNHQQACAVLDQDCRGLHG